MLHVERQSTEYLETGRSRPTKAVPVRRGQLNDARAGHQCRESRQLTRRRAGKARHNVLAKINTGLPLALFVVTVGLCLVTLTGLAEAQGTGPATAASTSAVDSILSWARIAQAIAAVIALVLGGIFAWRRGFIFRHQQPHVTISHDVTHRPIGHGYLHIEVTATLHNTSRVKVEFRDGLFTVERLAPVDGDTADRLFDDVIDKDFYESPKWDVLGERRLQWGKDELIVEPGEMAATTFEHIVSDAVESVLVTTYFYNTQVVGEIPVGINPRDADRRKRLRSLRRISGPRGWTRTTAHDIKSTIHDLEPG